MWIFTDGVATVRVLLRAEGCEVRYGAVILMGNEDLAILLAHLHDDPHAVARERLAARVDVPAQAISARVQETLDAMADSGIPRGVWGPWSTAGAPETSDRTLPASLPASSSPAVEEKR